jgi:hypothetical protein
MYKDRINLPVLNNFHWFNEKAKISHEGATATISIYSILIAIIVKGREWLVISTAYAADHIVIAAITTANGNAPCRSLERSEIIPTKLVSNAETTNNDQNGVLIRSIC